MKKRLLWKSNEGFALPFVMFFCTIFIVTLFTTVEIYKNELTITKNILNDYRVKTIFLRAKKDLQNMDSIENEKQLSFEYEDGQARITFSNQYEQFIELKYVITLSDDYLISLTDYMPIEKVEDENDLPSK